MAKSPPPVFGNKFHGTVVPGKKIAVVVTGGTPFVQAEVRPITGKFVKQYAAKKPSPIYTGEEVVGIAVMHKSCLQPVFSQEAAVDSAKMRRG